MQRAMMGIRVNSLISLARTAAVVRPPVTQLTRRQLQTGASLEPLPASPRLGMTSLISSLSPAGAGRSYHSLRAAAAAGAAAPVLKRMLLTFVGCVRARARCRHEGGQGFAAPRDPEERQRDRD